MLAGRQRRGGAAGPAIRLAIIDAARNRIVKALSKQLEGTSEQVSQRGLTTRVAFPI